MAIGLILLFPTLIASLVTIYFWKKDNKSGFLGKTIPEFIRIWIWVYIITLLIIGTILNMSLN